MMMMMMMKKKPLAVEFSPPFSSSLLLKAKTFRQSLIIFLPFDMRKNSAPAYNGNIIIIYYSYTIALYIYIIFFTH